MQTPPFPEGKKYSIIYADPPWPYKVWNEATGSGRSATQHYNTMTWEDLFNLPVKNLMHPNCALALWVVPPSLDNCILVLKAWGFQYITKLFCWVKKTKNDKDHFGNGYYTRANSEDCLLGTYGEMPVWTNSMPQIQRIPETIEAKHEGHSRKPAVFRDRIVELFDQRNHRSKIELFARPPFANDWDVWTDMGFFSKDDPDREIRYATKWLEREAQWDSLKLR